MADNQTQNGNTKPEASKTETKKEKKIPVSVAASQASRWCIKKQFTPEPQEIEVTEAELEELHADPVIIVIEL